MPAGRIKTFEEFWPFYLGEHSLPVTRGFHYVGTTLALVQLIVALVSMTWQPLLGALFSAYFCAWTSHFFIEKNRPATFAYPLWSFVSDWRMWALWLTRRLDAELKRHQIVPKSAGGVPVKS